MRTQKDKLELLEVLLDNLRALVTTARELALVLDEVTRAIAKLYLTTETHKERKRP